VEDLIFQKIMEYDVLKEWTNFALEHFETVWNIIQTTLDTIKKGKKAKISNKDALVLTLYHYKLGFDTGKILGQLKILGFSFKVGVVDGAIKRMNIRINMPLKEKFMHSNLYKEKQDKHFTEFSEVACVGDATVFPTYKPYTTFENAKQYFSGKHNIYCIKIDTSHTPTGLLVSHSTIFPGSVHDITVKKNKD